MLVNIDDITIKADRRDADTDQVRELSKSIAEVGLLNPITIDHDHTLIAGLHRLEAVRLLGHTEIECTVSSLEGLQAQLAEIDENFVRRNLSSIEYGDLLLKRKEIYEALHPESKNGGDRKSEKIRNAKCISDPVRSFAQDTAEKLGVNPTTITRQIQTAKNLTPEAKEIIRDADVRITKKEAAKLSRLDPEQQKEAASQLAQNVISKVNEYQPEGSMSSAKSEENKAEPDKEQGMAAPFAISDKQFSSFKESIADLKDPNKDCSCTPDSFLAEVSSLVKNFRRSIEWFKSPYYEVVFPTLTETQVSYVKEQMDSISEIAKYLYKSVERTHKNGKS